jgi:hypothetical protein
MKSLGRHGHLTVEQARKLAQAALGQLAQGDDPFVAEAVGQTFADLVPRFLDRQRQRLRPKSLREVTRPPSPILGPWPEGSGRHHPS